MQFDKNLLGGATVLMSISGSDITSESGAFTSFTRWVKFLTICDTEVCDTAFCAASTGESGCHRTFRRGFVSVVSSGISSLENLRREAGRVSGSFMAVHILSLQPLLECPFIVCFCQRRCPAEHPCEEQRCRD